MATRARRDEGFTLIELMVTILVLGVLSAIALPSLSKQKDKAFTGALKASLRDAAGAQESWSAETGRYTVDVDELQNAGFRSTDGISLSMTLVGNGFCITADHVSGRRLYFTNVGPSAGKPTTTAC